MTQTVADPRPADAPRLVVFVHGFASDPHCWEPLLTLLHADSTLNGAFAFDTYKYPTGFFELDPRRRIPRLAEVADHFGEWLEEHRGSYRDLMLVGHSMGGLLILKYVLSLLEAQRGRELEILRLRQIILVATPNLGSTFGLTTRRLLTHLFDNKQHEALEALGEEATALCRDIQQKVVMTGRAAAGEFAVPIQCFWGMEDDIVPETTARGMFQNAHPLPGDHHSIICPESAADDRYRMLVDALREPVGHPRVFEIEKFAWHVAPRPTTPGETFAAPAWGATRQVTCESVAKVRQVVSFARKNCCGDIFEVRYGTRQDGYLEARCYPPKRNEASADALQDYEDRGTPYVFKFRPTPLLDGEMCELSAKVFKGFDTGNRNIHIHLEKEGNRYYRAFECTVDLSEYLKAGFRITRIPEFRFDPEDQPHSDMCSFREDRPTMPPVMVNEGVWTWLLKDLRRGIIDLEWDVAK